MKIPSKIDKRTTMVLRRTPMEEQHIYEIYTCNPDDPSVKGWDIIHVLSTDSLIAKYPLFDCIITKNDSEGHELVEFTCLK